MTSHKSLLFAVANIALATLVLGCGESVPQRSAEGGILAGTNVERQKYAQRRNPLLTGNAPEEVRSTPSPSASPLMSSPTPRPAAGAAAPAGAATPAPDAGTTPDAPATPETPATPATPADTGTGAAPAPGASESGGTNPPGGVTSGTVTGGPETTTGGATGGGQR